MEKQTAYEPRPDRHMLGSLSNMTKNPDAFNPPRVTRVLDEEPFQSPLHSEPDLDPKEVEKTLGWKKCIKPDCKFAGIYQHGNNFHKNTNICKDCKRKYDAAYKAGKKAIQNDAARKATAPEKTLCLTNRVIPGSMPYYLIQEADIKRLIVEGKIQSGDIIVRAKTVSREQLEFNFKAV